MRGRTRDEGQKEAGNQKEEGKTLIKDGMITQRGNITL